MTVHEQGELFPKPDPGGSVCTTACCLAHDLVVFLQLWGPERNRWLHRDGWPCIPGKPRHPWADTVGDPLYGTNHPRSDRERYERQRVSKTHP